MICIALLACYLVITLYLIVDEVRTYLSEYKKAKETGATLYWPLASQIVQIFLWPLIIVYFLIALLLLLIESIKESDSSNGN